MASAQKFDSKIGNEKEIKKKRSGRLYLLLGLVIILIVSAAAYNQLGITSSVTADLDQINAQNKDEDPSAFAKSLQRAQNSDPPQQGTTIQQKSKKSSDIIKIVIELRNDYMKKDTVKTSEAVTKLETLVKVLDSSSIQEAWDTLTLCLARSCSDNDFLEFMNGVAIEGAKTGMKNAQLIADLITANKYWGTDNVVRLSEAITAVDKEVKFQNQPALSKSWQAIVSCDGKCSEKTRLIFDFLSALS